MAPVRSDSLRSAKRVTFGTANDEQIEEPKRISITSPLPFQSPDTKENTKNKSQSQSYLKRLLCWREKTSRSSSEHEGEEDLDEKVRLYRIPTLYIEKEGSMDDWISYIFERHSNNPDKSMNEEELLEAWKGFERVSRYLSHKQKAKRLPLSFARLGPGTQLFDKEMIQRAEEIFEADGMSKDQSVAFFGRLLALHYMSTTDPETWTSQYGAIGDTGTDRHDSISSSELSKIVVPVSRS